MTRFIFEHKLFWIHALAYCNNHCIASYMCMLYVIPKVEALGIKVW
jgi:hypothetical protein